MNTLNKKEYTIPLPYRVILVPPLRLPARGTIVVTTKMKIHILWANLAIVVFLRAIPIEKVVEGVSDP